MSATIIDISAVIAITVIAGLLLYAMFQRTEEAYAIAKNYIKKVVITWLILGLTPSIFVAIWGMACVGDISSW